MVYVVLLLGSSGFSQDNTTNRLFLDVPPDTFVTRIDSLIDSLKIPDSFIIPRSEKIFQNSFRLLRGINYQLEDVPGVVVFLQPPQIGDSITVIYQKYPFPLVPSYYHHVLEKVSGPDTTAKRAKSYTGLMSSRFIEDFDNYSSNLESSGSIVRGVEIGSGRDLTLNSGLNLQLSGYVTPDVQLVAALTDESTPIQPEGNTQTLQEVDKVFVKINSPHLGGTLGDFNLSYKNSQFGNLNRKLQGITANGDFSDYHQQVTYATSRGTFHTNQFLGQEGNQGPYQLVGKNGEREIIVLAGTERVFINGESQIRGENNAYVIDYSLGQITFSNNRLISSEDRIEVDFEYANNYQRYGKSFIGLSSARQPIGSGFSYDLRLFREWDDTNNLLEDSSPLTEEEKRALEKAGDNPLAASVSGADSVGYGSGNYVKRDTLLNNVSYQYYLYQGSGNGNYLVRFSSVGRGNGSYIKKRIGVYQFVGPGLGEYLPIRLIPLAGDNKLANLRMTYRFGKHFMINAESGISLYDRNVFSELDDKDNLGQAYTVSSNYNNDDTRFAGKGIGSINWQINWKRQGKRFTPLDRPYQPEYNYKWNLSNADLISDENLLESTLYYHPGRFFLLNLEGGLLDRGNSISSRRGRAQLISSDTTVVNPNLYWEIVSSKDPFQKSDWNRRGAELSRRIGKFIPLAGIRQEDRQVNREDSLLTGFRYDEGFFGLKFYPFFGTRWQTDSRFRTDYLYDPDNFGERLKLANSFTQSLSVAILENQRWQGRLSLQYRDKNYQPFFESLPPDSIARYQPDPQFQDTSWVDRQTHLARLELQYRNSRRTIDSRWDYRVASELQALQEKVFLDVGENRGNYRFDQDLQEYVPDPQGNYLLVIVPTGDFKPITNIEASWQIRYRPPVADKKYHGFSRIARNISFFSLLKVDEKSQESNIWQLYILNLSKYHNKSTTLQGTYTLNQEIYFFERNPDFGITLSSRYRDNLSNQFIESGYNETRRNWDRSVTWRQRIYRKVLSQELAYGQIIDYRSVSDVPSRDRDIFTHTARLKLNYRPVYAWQIELNTEAGFQKDKAELNKLDVRYLEIRPQVNYSVRGKARALANLTYLRVDVTNNPLSKPIPFEMGKGKKEGNSYLWTFRFEYFISTNITSTINYTGRLDAGFDRIIHLGQAEIRAFF